MEKFTRFFCSECGKWLGVKEFNSSMNGIYPYCPRCKKQVETSEFQTINFHRDSAKCRQ